MADAEPLFALLEIMLRSFNVSAPKITPGGHPDDVFIRLTDEEREEFECSICYQVIKEARQCINNHKFCYSCIFVWSTSGSPVNHGRCPVCRADGNYVRNKELDEKINKLAAKCATKGCKWVGVLRHLPSHRHTNYSDTTDANSNELPTLTPSASAEPRTRLLGASSGESVLNVISDPSNASTQAQPSSSISQRRPLTNVPNNTSNSLNRSSSVSQRQTNGTNQSSTRSRTRSRTRTNASSPQRRSNTSVTGLHNSRLTSRARIQNGSDLSGSTNRQRDENSEPSNTRIMSRARIQNGQSLTSTSNRQITENTGNVSTPSEPALTPRPPVTPRPQAGAGVRRRMPTLPNLMNDTSNNNENPTTPVVNQSISRTDNNNNVSVPTPEPLSFLDTPRRNPLESSIGRRLAATPRGFANVRDRLNESRQRLDMLMNAFSVELDRGRHDLTAFQTEREIRRQEQLAEVRDLGIRLGQVATELRGLLSQRRQIRTQIDHMVGSSGTEETE